MPAAYRLIDKLETEYELDTFTPESDHPGGAASVEMTRAYDDIRVYAATRDYGREPAVWQWQGQLIAPNAASLHAKISSFLSFTKRTKRVVRAYDGAFIELYGVTAPIITPSESRIHRDVTFGLLVTELAWTRPTNRPYGSGIYGSGIYPDGSGFDKEY